MDTVEQELQAQGGPFFLGQDLSLVVRLHGHACRLLCAACGVAGSRPRDPCGLAGRASALRCVTQCRVQCLAPVMWAVR